MAKLIKIKCLDNAQRQIITEKSLSVVNYQRVNELNGVQVIGGYLDKIPIPVPYMDSSYIYTGHYIYPQINNYLENYIVPDGSLNALNVGTYTANFYIKNTLKYKWEDGTIGAKNLSWEIIKKPIKIPYQKTPMPQTANEQAPVWEDYDTNYVEIISQTSALNPGTYYTVFKLKDSNNTVWEDETTADKIIAWTIEEVNCKITILGTGNSNCNYITINDIKYYNSITLSVPFGTNIICTCSRTISINSTNYCTIKINNIQQAHTETYNETITYNFNVERDCQITLTGSQNSNTKIIDIIH